MPCDLNQERAGVVTTIVKRLALFSIARGPMTHVLESLVVRGRRRPNRPTVWTGFWLCAVLGLNTHCGACSWFKHTEVRFGKPESASLKEENGRRPMFLIFWPIEVP